MSIQICTLLILSPLDFKTKGPGTCKMDSAVGRVCYLRTGRATVADFLWFSNSTRVLVFAFKDLMFSKRQTCE